MTDGFRRSRQRRGRTDGCPESNALGILDRLRAGELEQSKVFLAAYCGFQDALALYPDISPPAKNSLSASEWIWSLGVTNRKEAFEAGVAGYESWAGEVCAVAAHAAFSVTVPLEPGTSTGIAVSALRDWIREPSQRNANALRIASAHLRKPFQQPQQTDLRAETAASFFIDFLLGGEAACEGASTCIHFLALATERDSSFLIDSMQQEVVNWCLTSTPEGPDADQAPQSGAPPEAKPPG